jgi:hypothetical protein
MQENWWIFSKREKLTEITLEKNPQKIEFSVEKTKQICPQKNAYNP